MLSRSRLSADLHLELRPRPPRAVDTMLAILTVVATSLSLLPAATGLPHLVNDANPLPEPYALVRRSTSNSSSHVNDATGYQGAAACVSTAFS